MIFYHPPIILVALSLLAIEDEIMRKIFFSICCTVLLMFGVAGRAIAIPIIDGYKVHRGNGLFEINLTLSNDGSYQGPAGGGALIKDLENTYVSNFYFHEGGGFQNDFVDGGEAPSNWIFFNNSTTGFSFDTVNQGLENDTIAGFKLFHNGNISNLRVQINGAGNDVDFGSTFSFNVIYNLELTELPPVCSSTVVTISDLKIEVENLETSSMTIKVLSRNLDNAQQALDKGNNKTARSQMGNFISKVVNRSNFEEGDPNRIALDEANSLLCGAANVLIGIELP